MTFDGSLKEFCLGMTVKEINDYFKDNYNPQTQQTFCNGIYYQLAIDRVFAKAFNMSVDSVLEHIKEIFERGEYNEK